MSRPATLIAKNEWLESALWLALLLALAARTLQFWPAPPFSPDSWSYYELAKGVFDDFYRIVTWRQFQFTESYGVSFPPLWPVVIASTDALLATGWRSGLVANLAIVLATAVVLRAAAARLCGSAAFGVLIALALLAHRSYCEEVFAGRALPLAILLWVAIVWRVQALPRDRVSSLATVLLALLVGFATLTRFDFLPAALALTLLLPASIAITQSPRAALHFAVLWLPAIALVLLPWAWYGELRFDRPFVSDNTRTVLAAVRTHVHDFYVAPLPTLFDAPQAWLAKTTAGAASVAGQLVKALLINLLLLALLWLAIRNRTQHADANVARATSLRWLVCDLAALGQVSSVLLAGFASIRYALPLEVYLLLRLGVLLQGSAQHHGHGRVLLAAVGLQFVLLAVPALRPWLNPPTQRVDTTAYAPFADCLATTANARVLFLTDDNENAHRFGALHGIGTLATPYNYRDAPLDVLIRRFGATHVYDELRTPLPGGLANRLAATLRPQCGLPRLYRLDLATPASA